MDLFLYQLNISGLTVLTALIAWFFHVLRRSIRRAEMRWWTYGWYANAAALAITSVFWAVQPPAGIHGLVFGVYLAPKAVYVWLMVRGALEFHGTISDISGCPSQHQARSQTQRRASARLMLSA
ncbi:MAG: hypothetical protein CK533_00290 [Acidobacterium sp.]|nr:hypothetical protein [Acidobacteriota bacterium]PHY12167.1 MAG: hypothetical protein CK533_00290 [Acidobacterium sp.]